MRKKSRFSLHPFKTDEKILLVTELARAIKKMQAELETKEKGIEQFEEIFTEKIQTVKEIERMILLQVQKDLETKLIRELQEKLQFKQLEKAIIEEEKIKQAQEETEEQKEILHGYSIEIETFYSKEQGAYQVKQPYKQDHGSQIGYESKS